jgi:hypothetical protein
VFGHFLIAQNGMNPLVMGRVEDKTLGQGRA